MLQHMHLPLEPPLFHPGGGAGCIGRRGAARAAGRRAPRVAAAALRARPSRPSEGAGGDSALAAAEVAGHIAEPPALVTRKLAAAAEPKLKTRRPAAKKAAPPATASEPALLLPPLEAPLILAPEPTRATTQPPPRAAASEEELDAEPSDDGDGPDPDELDYGPLDEAAGGAAPVLPAGRELGARDWKAVVDWQLMGHEHVSMPDAEFAELCTRVKGLQDKWRPMVSYLHSLGLRERELTRLVQRESQIFVGNVGRARSRVAFLQSSLAVTQAELVRILEVAPRVLFLRVERTLAKRLAFLESLDIPREKLGHVVSRMPTLLYTTVDTLEPRVQYLNFVLKMTRAEVGRMVLRHPNVLTCNEGMLESRLLFLFTLGLSDEQIKRMVMNHPQLLQYAPDNMAPRVTWLLEEVGMTPEEVVHTVSRLSQLFSLSVDNSLRPKYRYLCNELRGNKAMLLQSPTFLSLSLAARIRPRHRFMMRLGRSPPYSMFEFTSADANFARAMDAPLEEWLAFRDACVLEHEAAVEATTPTATTSKAAPKPRARTAAVAEAAAAAR